jgi:hypothetical protein
MLELAMRVHRTFPTLVSLSECHIVVSMPSSIAINHCNSKNLVKKYVKVEDHGSLLFYGTSKRR